jgi:hypothetical protein
VTIGHPPDLLPRMRSISPEGFQPIRRDDLNDLRLNTLIFVYVVVQPLCFSNSRMRELKRPRSYCRASFHVRRSQGERLLGLRVRSYRPHRVRGGAAPNCRPLFPKLRARRNTNSRFQGATKRSQVELIARMVANDAGGQHRAGQG